MKPPAFQFYPDDFLGGTMHFSDAETGLYIRLLCVQWSTGGLPDSDAELASYGKGETQIVRVRSKFSKCDDGLLRNERLEIEREKQEAYRLSRSINGKQGGRPCKPHGKHKVLKTKAQESSPSPSPSPSPTPAPNLQSSPNGASAPGAAFTLQEFPESIRSARVMNKWTVWQTVRRGMKKANWLTLFNSQAEWLSQFNEPKVFEILDQSIRNGWQGLFEPKNYGTKSTAENPRNFGMPSTGKQAGERAVAELRARGDIK